MTFPATSRDRQGATVAPNDAGAFLDRRPRVTLSGATPSPEAGREDAPNRFPSRPAHPIIETHLGDAPC